MKHFLWLSGDYSVDALNSNVKLAPEKYAFDATPPVVANKNGSYPVAVPGVSNVTEP